jgi:hypothetical protein
MEWVAHHFWDCPTSQEWGLDLLTLLAHTFEFQLFDASIFKPFKISFHKFQDIWIMAKKHRFAWKEDLA